MRVATSIGLPMARAALALLFASLAPTSFATNPPSIHIVYLGGPDCPPCEAWRANELPKLEKTAAFKSVKFTYVLKGIRSPVPSSFFLPTDVKPLKEKLDYASARRAGSPHFAIVVDDEVFDYFFGTRSAEQIEKMIESLRDGTQYPFTPCKRISGLHRCEKSG